jgi:hypothetical protein
MRARGIEPPRAEAHRDLNTQPRLPLADPRLDADEERCGREGSNLQGPRAHRDLNPARLPVPPRPRVVRQRNPLGNRRAMTENRIDPDELTSPGTVEDPELERRRAAEAAVREAESREDEETKFEQLRKVEEEERHEAAEIVGEVPAPIND